MQPIGKGDEQNRRRKSKGSPGENTADPTVSNESNGVIDLTTGGTRQKLAEGDQVRIGLVREPAPTAHKFIMKIPNVSDRTTKGGASKSQKDKENGKK